MRGASAHPIQILPEIYPIQRQIAVAEMQHSRAKCIHGKLMICLGFPGARETRPAVGYRAGTAETAFGLKHWNKTGTFAAGMLYVDNRRSPGSRDQRAYRVGPRVVPRRVPGLKPAAEPPAVQ